MAGVPFWKAKSLEEMTPDEWESLCDGCGLCCLNKLEDWDTGEVVFTCVGCRLLDGETARCRSYENRKSIVEDCIQLTPAEVRAIAWLPPTCAYRLVRDGEDLKWWHPLVSGDAETVHEAGISVRGRTIDEQTVDIDDYEHYVVDWPLKVGDGRE